MGTFVVDARSTKPGLIGCLDKGVMVTTDDAHPNVLYMDRNARVIMIQINDDCYEVRKGRCHIGDVTFGRDNNGVGWIFQPRTAGYRISRQRYRYPEWAIRRKHF